MKVQHFFFAVSKSPAISKANDIIIPRKIDFSTKSSNRTFLKNPMYLFFATSKLCGSSDFNTILLWPIAYVASCSMFGLMVVEATSTAPVQTKEVHFYDQEKKVQQKFLLPLYTQVQQHIGMEHEKLQKIVHPAPTGLS